MIIPERPWPWAPLSPLRPVVGRGGAGALAALPTGDGDLEPKLVCVVVDGEAKMMPPAEVPTAVAAEAEDDGCSFLDSIPE